MKKITINVPDDCEVKIVKKDSLKNTSSDIKSDSPVIRTYQDLIDNDKTIRGYSVGGDSSIIEEDELFSSKSSYNVAYSEKVAKSMIAMAMISQLMPYYGGEITNEEWNDHTDKYTIEKRFGEIYRTSYQSACCFLAFHTEKQRNEFIKYNEQLVKDYLMIENEK